MDSKELRILSTIIRSGDILRLPSGYVIQLLIMHKTYHKFFSTAIFQAPASPIFSLQIDPIPVDRNALLSDPIMIVFDVVRQ